MLSALVGDYWSLASNNVDWKDEREHIYRVHLPTLISSAASEESPTEVIWHELPTPPVKVPLLLAYHGNLLLMGGRKASGEIHHYVREIHRFDQDSGEWKLCGQLPVEMYASSSAVLPSGEIIVAGGYTKDTRDFSKRMWITSIEN